LSTEYEKLPREPGINKWSTFGIADIIRQQAEIKDGVVS
jgi:hypothetical protein